MRRRAAAAATPASPAEAPTLSRTRRLSNWLKSRRQRRSKKPRPLWWFDVLYPALLGLLLFSALSYIVYSGQRQFRLSLQMEKRLMQFSLTEARGQLPKSPEQITVVDLDPNATSAATLAAYQAAVTNLAAAGVPRIFLQWNLGKDGDDGLDYLPLLATLIRIAPQTTVFLVTPPEKADRVPGGLRQHAVWLEDEDNGACDEAGLPQTECSFLPGDEYKEWLIQRILVELSPGGKSPKPRNWVSAQLTSGMPSYLLNLSPPGSLHHLSSAALQANPDAARGAAAAFVGSASSRAEVATVYDRVGRSSYAARTPVYVFWAMLGQMFVDGRTTAVPDVLASAVFTAVVCLAFFLVTVAFGATYGLGIYIVYVILAPFANAALIRWGHAYEPLFDSYYFGMSMFVVAGLGRLSLLTIQRWRLEATSRLHTRVTDLKGNFVSLLSHNLNTPVAKMQGMLALFAKQPGVDPQPVAEAEALVTQLELAIRSVLIASALEEGVRNETPRTVLSLGEELVSSFTLSLKRLGIHLDLAAIDPDDDMARGLPVHFDARAVTAAICGIAALYARTDLRAATIRVELGVVETDGGAEVLRVSLRSEQAWLSPFAASLLSDTRLREGQAAYSEHFFAEVIGNLVHWVLRSYHGQIELHPSAKGGGEVGVRLQANTPTNRT